VIGRSRLEQQGGTTLCAGAGAANNLAKPDYSWSCLARSGDTLYGVTEDPASGADIEIHGERTGRPSPHVRG
jgi:hypothetical protein